MNSSENEIKKSSAQRPNILLRLLGPGLVTGAADDDPSGIATYSQAGAQFGYGLLWTVFLTTPFMIAIQLVSAQIGRVTGKGIVASVKDFAPRWFVISLVSLLVMANTFNIAADLAAMGEALSLVIGGLDREHALIFAAISVLLQVFVRYRRYAPVLKFLTLVLFLYVATAFTVHIPWGEAFARAVWPAAEVNRDYLLMVVAVLGTTISPYLFFWQASQEVEQMKQNRPRRRPLKELSRGGESEIARIALDTSVGMAFSNIIAFIARGPSARRLGCVWRFRGVRLARHARGESAGCRRVLQHHCRRHGGGTRARLYANQSHPNAGLERRAQWHCRCSDHGGHDGGRYAPFGDGSLQRQAGTHLFRMGRHGADGRYCCCTALVFDWLTRTLSASKANLLWSLFYI